MTSKVSKLISNVFIDDLMRKMNEFIYNLIVGLLIAIIDPVIREIIREKNKPIYWCSEKFSRYLKFKL